MCDFRYITEFLCSQFPHLQMVMIIIGLFWGLNECMCLSVCLGLCVCVCGIYISNLKQCLAHSKFSTSGSQYCSCVDLVVTVFIACHLLPLFILHITWLYRVLILQINFGTTYQISVKQRQWKLSYNFVMLSSHSHRSGTFFIRFIPSNFRFSISIVN